MTPAQLLAHVDAGTLWPSHAGWPVDLDSAYRDALAMRALREARGERPAGFKIGFTNRTIWARYAVYAPIWGTVWDTTLQHAPNGAASLSLERLCQPRLEPEVVFGLRSAPPREPGLEQLFESIEWIATGFEIVQSHAADWRFTAPETAADGALHGRLFVGPPRPVRELAASGAGLDDRLAATTIRLLRDGHEVDRGEGRHVLDGPLHALQHFAHELQRCPGAPALQAGDVITTGTWTDAWPLQSGQQWRAEFEAPLAPFALHTG